MNSNNLIAAINDLQSALACIEAEARDAHRQLTDAGVPVTLSGIEGRADAVHDRDATLTERVGWLLTVCEATDRAIREYMLEAAACASQTSTVKT